jgi:hypothetical protein
MKTISDFAIFFLEIIPIVFGLSIIISIIEVELEKRAFEKKYLKNVGKL